MKERILSFMANEGMTVESIRKFEDLYDKELHGDAKLELVNAMNAQEAAAASAKNEVQRLAEDANIRK